MHEARTSPASRIIARAEVVNARLGNENLGSLSATRGFVPLLAPRLSLPGSHGAWDEVAAQLPTLYRDMAVRRAVERMPVLPADRSALPDSALQRAATVLGILGHAYVHVSAPEPADVPPSIAIPWAEVRSRLCRGPEPVLAYTDLIVNNWRVDGDADGGPVPLRAGSLRLLVPTVDNREERVFYLSQLEILARCAPIVPAVAVAQDAVLSDDPDRLRNALGTVAEVLGTVSRSSLTLIDPRPRSATHVDPVVWAKTVAPLAVPFRPGVLGPSGTASPIFNLLDAFLGRRSHRSQLGSEIELHRRSYPVHWRSLLDAVERVSVADYVAAHPRSGLAGSLDAAREAYAGPDGFLGHHRRKVYGYLSVAFKVGRGVTIGGFSGPPQARTWNKVDAELTESRAERLPSGSSSSGIRRCPESRSRGHDAADGARRPVTASELARHNDAANGWWLAIDGRVHDVTDLVERHPGGQAVLCAHTGLDATTAFERAHAGRPGLGHLLAMTDIGFLADPDLGAARDVYRNWIDALFTVVELQNTFRLDRSFGEGTDLCAPGGRRASPFQMDRAVDTCTRFRDEYLPRFAGEILLPLAERVASVRVRSPSAGLPTCDHHAECAAVPAATGRPTAGGDTAPAPPTAQEPRDRLDQVADSLGVVKSMLRAGARRFEDRGDTAIDDRDLRQLVERSIWALGPGAARRPPPRTGCRAASSVVCRFEHGRHRAPPHTSRPPSES